MDKYGAKILWDLTRSIVRCFNRKQMKKLLLAFLGLGKGAKRVSPLAVERRRFEEEVRGQFIKLKEKGLGIRVFTL